jgi:hypothetical protein
LDLANKDVLSELSIDAKNLKQLTSLHNCVGLTSVQITCSLGPSFVWAIDVGI